MQFLTVSRRRTEFPEAEFSSRVEAECERARMLYEQGVIRQIWHRTDVPGACILMEADSEEHVKAFLNTLPLMQAGMLDVMIIPLKPYAGFGPRMVS